MAGGGWGGREREGWEDSNLVPLLLTGHPPPSLPISIKTKPPHPPLRAASQAVTHFFTTHHLLPFLSRYFPPPDPTESTHLSCVGWLPGANPRRAHTALYASLLLLLLPPSSSSYFFFCFLFPLSLSLSLYCAFLYCNQEFQVGDPRITLITISRLVDPPTLAIHTHTSTYYGLATLTPHTHTSERRDTHTQL